MGEVRVVYRKFNGALHWNMSLRRLGEDEYGIWLGAPAGIETRRGYEPPIVAGAAHVLLIPPNGWWTATYNADNGSKQSRSEVYIDITTVPEWPEPDLVTMVDLDLDVVRRRPTGLVELLDEDEFAEHRAQFGYPPDVVANAEASAARLFAEVTKRVEPFDQAPVRWLDLVAT